MNMRKVNMITYPLEEIHPINYCLQSVTWGGVLDSKLSNKITFFHSVRRIE